MNPLDPRTLEAMRQRHRELVKEAEHERLLRRIHRTHSADGGWWRRLARAVHGLFA